MAAEPGRTYLLYIPKNSSGKTIMITGLRKGRYCASWFDPRNGSSREINEDRLVGKRGQTEWTVPDRPDDNDWVLWLRKEDFQVVSMLHIP